MKITIRGKHYPSIPSPDEYRLEESCTMEITATDGLIQSESNFIASTLTMLSMSGVTDIRVEH